MLKNLKRASAFMLSLAMAVQFGLADTYYANTLSEEPIIEETQEQEPVTVEEGSQQVAVEQTEAPAIDAKEEFVQVPETKSVTLSYVAEDGTILQDATTHEYEIDYSLNSDASVMLNFDGYTLKDVVMNDSQIVAAAQANLNVTSDLTSVKFVYQKVMTESHPEANEAQEENKTEEKTEEDAEADPEAKEELPEYPAFDMSATAGNVTVHVTAAEGVLPSGAQLIVKRVTRKAILNAVEETVTEKDKEVDSAIALDITIVNADGIEIQPNGIVNVSFENVAVGGEEVNIYHVTDDASTVTEVAANTQSFDANHFSIYVITGEKKVELTTFNFVAEGNTVSTQIVKTGDTLITPTAPDIAGKAFVEWQENGSKFDGFGVQTITKTETRTITAKYEDALYVYFYNPDGTQIMRTEKVADHNGHDYSHVSYDVNATHKLVGWAAEKNGNTNIVNSIAVPEGSTSVNVYAIIKEGYWVTFDSDGGSAIDSQFVFDKISLNDQTKPTKPGYTFGGWYNGSTKVVDGTQITEPMTLKAHWTPKQVSYTVIHWWENADDNGYSFHESETKKGLTGSETEAVAKSYTVDGKNIFGESVKDKVFTASTISQKTIKGDGSTIVNVYYKRKTYTMHFKEYSNSRTDLSTITKKWGQSISKDEWPAYDGNSNWKIREGSLWSSDRYIAFTSTMPMNDSTLWSTGGKNTYTAYYYVQKITGNGYDLHHTDVIKGSSYLTIGKEDCYAISGFTFEYCNPDVGESYNGASFYYTRNDYNLNFINNGKPEKTVSKKYEQSISSENYTPARPSSLPEYYVFDGWYENELCEGEAFNFTGQKMPAQNVTLYAKWTASNVKFTYNLNNPEGTVDKDTKKVEAGTVASTVLPSIPAINEYSFAGWYYADGNGNITSGVFHTGSTITRDTSIVGKWLYKGELRVVYDPGTEKDVTVPTDDRVYAGGARVIVAGNATTTSGKKFLGWELNGNVYKPGQSFEVNKDIANKDNKIILTATWGNAETSTTLTYDPGNGIGTATRVDVMNNEAVEIEAHGSLGFSAPVAEGKEYYFAGWADSKTGNATYADGQTINIDANGENVLYAVWVEKAKITVVAKSDEVTYDGNNHVVDGFNSLTIDGYTVSGLSASVSGTDAGTYNNVITGEATVTKDGKDVTDRVVVTKQNGTLTIKKRQVTLTSEGGSKTYDGTPLTKPNVTGGDGFVNGEVKDIKATGSVTNVSDGEVTNTITYTPNSAFKEGNYSITKNEGKLYITAKSIIPNPEEENDMACSTPSDVVYSGNEQRQPVTVTDKNVVLGTEDYDITYSEDVTNVGEVTITVTGKGNYTGEFTRTYQITPAPLSITTDSDTKVYDGKPLTADGRIEGLVNNEEVTFKVTGSQTIVGTSDNTYTLEFDKTAKEGNYSIADKDIHVGKLTVTAQSINPEAPDYSGISIDEPIDVTYDGEKHKWSPTVTDKENTALVENVDYTVSYNTENFINVQTIVVTIKGTGNYSGTVTRTYRITPATVTVIANNANKVYGETDPELKATVTGTLNDDTVDYTLTREPGEDVGEYTITPKGEMAQGNYIVEYATGTFEITPRSIKPDTPDTPEEEKTGIKVNNASDSIYNGQEHKFIPEITNKDGNTLVEGKDYEVSYSKDDFTNVTGEIVVTIKGKGNYTGEFTDHYQITKRYVRLSSLDDGKEYDGTPLTNTVLQQDSALTFVEGEASAEVTGTITNKGSVPNTITVVKTEMYKEDNYDFDTHEGILTITVKEVTVTANNANKVYGENDPELKATVTGTLGEDKVTYTLTRDPGEDVGTYAIHVTGDEDQGNYHVTYTAGEFEITKSGELKLTAELTGESATKVYDGTPLTGGATANVKEGTTITYSTDSGTTWTTEVPSITNVGTLTITARAENPNYEPAETTYSLTVTHATATVTADDKTKTYGEEDPELTPTVTGTLGEDKVAYTLARDPGEDAGIYAIYVTGEEYQGNYHVEYVAGTLEITRKSLEDEDNGIEVTNPDDTVYDGTSQKLKPTVADTKTNATLTEGTDYYLDYSADTTNVGTVAIMIKGTGNYSGSKAASYKITPRTVKLASEDATKPYDGTPLTRPAVIVTGDGFVEGEVEDIKATGTITNVGSVENTITYTRLDKFKESNYNITEDTGTLTVTQQTIDPEDPDPEKEYLGVTVDTPSDVTYDGNEHKWTPTVLDAEDKALTEGTDYTVSYDTEDFTNVHTITVTIEGIGNYTGTVTRTYRITPATVTVTANNANKVYGENDPELKATVTGTLNNDKVDYTLTREPGEDVGTYVINVTGDEDQGNYRVTYTAGEFEITKSGELILTAELTGESATKVYDGTPLTGGATANVKEGTTITYSTDGGTTWTTDVPAITNVGTLNITARAENSNYEPAETTYSLTVTHATATVTADDKTKTYGEADPEFTAKVEGIIGTEKDTVQIVYDQPLTRDPGEAKGTYTIHVTGETTQGNYHVEYVAGTLTVTQQTIDPEDPDPEKEYLGVTVDTPSNVTYDGNEHKWAPTVLDADDKALTEGTDYTVSYDTADFTNVHTITVTIEGIGNYTGTVVRTYAITPAEVTVTANNTGKVYGEADPELTAKVEGTIGNDEVIYKLERDPGEDVGTYVINVTGDEDQGNYRVTYTAGEFEITPKSIIPVTPEEPGKDANITVETPEDVKYNGESQQQKPVIKDDKGNVLEEGKDYTLEFSEDTTNAGTVTVTVTGINNYEGTFDVQYNILPRDITMTSGNAEKVYDGTALTNGEIVITGDGFVEGEGVTYNVTGTQTEAGSSANTFDYAFNENTLASNYKVTTVNGTLTVTPQTVVPVAPPQPPVNPGPEVTPQDTTTAEVQTPTTTITEQKTPQTAPKKTETIKNDPTPEAAGKAYWALINLICAAVTVVLAIFALLSKHKKEEDAKEDEDTDAQTVMSTEEDEEDPEISKRHRIWKVVGAVDAIVAVIVFFLTENMSLPMALTDKWTVLMVVFALISVVTTVFAKKWHKKDDDNAENNEEQNTLQNA